MKQLFQALIIIFSVSILSAIALSFDKETIKIKPFVTSKESCFSCHKRNEDPEKFEDLSMTCDNLCKTCHKEISNNNHHQTDIRVTYKTPIQLPLTKHDRIMCVTCHDIKGNRYDSKSWKAESLFDKTFNKKEKYKTYYLRIRNHDGKLCKNCH